MKRRSMLASTGAAMVGFALDPLGWFSKGTSVAAAETYEGFAVLAPGEARPRTVMREAREAVIPEEGAASPTVRTLHLTEAATHGDLDGPLAGTVLDSTLVLESVERLEYLSGGIVADTIVMTHSPTRRTVALTASPRMPQPYVLLPQGNNRDGFAQFSWVSWLPRPGLAIAPGFAAIGLWLEDDTLFRLEVIDDSPIGPGRMESVLLPVARAITRSS